MTLEGTFPARDGDRKRKKGKKDMKRRNQAPELVEEGKFHQFLCFLIMQPKVVLVHSVKFHTKQMSGAVYSARISLLIHRICISVTKTNRFIVSENLISSLCIKSFCYDQASLFIYFLWGLYYIEFCP